MSKPDPDDPRNGYLSKPLSKAAVANQRKTDISARVPRQPMLDEEDDEILDTFNKDFASIFDDPEKL